MGVIRFVAHSPERLAQRTELTRAYFTGQDQIPSSARIAIEDGQLVCEPRLGESGSLHLPWSLEGFGRPILATTTLAQRPQPYLLPLELARGKLNQVRNQLADWQSGGLETPATLMQRLREAQHCFHRAITGQHDPVDSDAWADSALRATLSVAEELTRCYGAQALEARHRVYPQFNTLWGCQLGEEAPRSSWDRWIPRVFNAVTVPVNWRTIEPSEGQYCWELYDQQVEWSLQQHLVVIGGPLVLMSPQGLPDWLWLWERDFANLVSFVSDFVETAVSHYHGKIRMWELIARANSSKVLSLSEEQRLRLTAQMLEVARQVDPEAHYYVRFDQPWGEYLAAGDDDLSPLHFADTLLRADLGVTAVGLEVTAGYQSPGSWPRDPMEFSRLLDLWSCLGVPLHLTVAVPSAEGPDAKACSGERSAVLPGAWRRPWDEVAQEEWMDAHLPVVLAKPAVQSVTWCHGSDAVPHEFAHAGLLRSDGTPKPALQTLARLRREHLK